MELHSGIHVAARVMIPGTNWIQWRSAFQCIPETAQHAYLSHNVAHLMHSVERRRNSMNIDQLLDNKHIEDDGNFAATVTKMCKLQIVWQFLAT